MVFLGLTMAWRLASWPTSRSPDSGKPTTDGVRFDPCLFGMTLTSFPSITQTTEFVVPRSMPTILPIGLSASRICRISMCKLFANRPRSDYLHPAGPQRDTHGLGGPFSTNVRVTEGAVRDVLGPRVDPQGGRRPPAAQPRVLREQSAAR